MRAICLPLIVSVFATNAQGAVICEDRSGFEHNGRVVSFEFHGDYGIYNALDLNGSGVTQTLFSCQRDRKGYQSCYVDSDVGAFTFVLVEDSTIVFTMFVRDLPPMTSVYDELECIGSQ